MVEEIKYINSDTGLLIMAKWVLLLICSFGALQANAVDRRAYQHGIDIITLPDGILRMFWSSAPGVPPQGAMKPRLSSGVECEYFVHDIYSSSIARQAPELVSIPVIEMQEAQEPVSAAVADSGTILLTFEDGSESEVVNDCESHIQQRYQLFNADLQPLTAIKTVSIAGGHSGHAATSGSYFVIAYAEGWVDGGGIDDGGSGDDIHVDIVDSLGKFVRHKNIAVGDELLRDDWPLVDGSEHGALLVWQRFADDEGYANLMYSMYDAEKDHLIKDVRVLETNLVYYHYDVRYLKNLDRFLVVGNALDDTVLPFGGNGIPVVTPRMFAFLLDSAGNIISRWTDESGCHHCGSYHYYNVVREAQPAVLEVGDQTAKVLYPVKPGGVVSLTVSAARIIADNFYETNNYWFPLGVDGVFLDKQNAYFVNLTPTGLRSVTVHVEN